MSDKVRLPKKVANAINEVRLNYKSGCEYDIDFLSKENYGDMKVITDFVETSRDHMMLYFQALVNGYEVEESPEDKVREWYQGLQSQLDSGVNGPYREQVVRELTTIDKCIRLLNIKIEGVNA